MRLRACLLALLLAPPVAAQSYTAASVPWNPQNQNAGTQILAGSTNEISPVIAFPAGFAFPFYGVDRTAFRVSTNGWLTFDTGWTAPMPDNTALPQPGGPDGLVAPLWDALSTFGVWYRLDTRGTAAPADDRFLVEWLAYPSQRARAPENILSFEVHLYRSGAVEFHYTNGPASISPPETDATVGLEGPGGQDGTQTYFSAGGPGAGTLPANETALRFTFDPACPALTAPADNAAGVPYTDASLTWAGSTALRYLVDAGSAPGATDLRAGFDVGGGQVLRFLGELTAGQAVHWRVRVAGRAADCAGRRFTTAPPVAVTPASAFSEGFGASVAGELPPGWLSFTTGSATPFRVLPQWDIVAAESSFRTGRTVLATPALALPAGAAVLRFRAWQAFEEDEQTTFRVLVRPAGPQADLAGYTEAARWTETTACPGGTGPFPTGAVNGGPPAPNCALSLAPWAGQTVHVAFVAERLTEPTPSSDVLILDDVSVAATVGCAAFNGPPAGDADYGRTVVSWSPDPNGAQPTGYRLTVTNNDLPADTRTVTTGATSVTFNGALRAGATYTARLVPSNALGEAADCPPYTFSTAGPSAPTAEAPFLEPFDGFQPPARWATWTTGANPQAWAVTGFGTISGRATSAGASLLATPALVVPSGGRLTFRGARSAADAVFRVLVRPGGPQAETAGYTELASWTSATACPGATAPFPAIPAQSNVQQGAVLCSADLSAWAGQAVHVAFSVEPAAGQTASARFDLADVSVVGNAPPACAAWAAPPADGVDYNRPVLAWTRPATGGAPTGYRLSVTADADPADTQTLTTGAVESATLARTLRAGAAYTASLTPTNDTGEAAGCPTLAFTTAAPTPVAADAPFAPSVGSLGPRWATFAEGANTRRWEAPPGLTLVGRLNAVPGASVLVSPALSLPASGATLSLRLAQGWTEMRGTRYRVLVRPAGPGRPLAGYTETAAWTEDQPCPGGSGPLPFLPEPGPNCFVGLGAWAGQTVHVALSVESGTGRPSADELWLSLFRVDVPGLVGADAPVAFAEAGACAQTTATTAQTRVRNVGVGPARLVSATFAGPGAAAFSMTRALPLLFPSGTLDDLPLRFAPPPGASGPQTATMLLTVEGATAPLAVAVEGPATDASVHAGQGGGYAFASDVGGACAAPGAPAPAGLVPLDGHTRVEAWTGGPNNGFVDLPASAVGRPAIRFHGRARPGIRLSVDGRVRLTGGPSVAGTPDLRVLSTNLDLTPATYASDAAGRYGPPGVFYGASDVDADGRPDAVFTWWHAHAAGSPAFPSPAAQMATAQLILYGAPDNVEPRVEVRIPAGLDANGVPFQQRAAEAPLAGATIEVGGLGRPARYRGDTEGGPLADGDGLVVRFTPLTQATATGGPGWRQMSLPVGFSVGYLAELNLVQGVPGQYPAAAPNLYTGYDGSQFVAPASAAQFLPPGAGVFWYLYDADLDPDDTALGGGTSRSFALPMALQATGSGSLSEFAIPLHADGDGFNLAGNAFDGPISLADLLTWEGADALASAVGQIWDPALGSYVPTTALGDRVGPWQGVWLEASAPGQLIVLESARTTGGGFLGKDSTAAAVSGPPRLSLRLDGARADGTGPVHDRAAAVVFAPDAAPGWDPRDASKLSPPADAFASVAVVGERGGQPRLLAEAAVPPLAASGRLVLPLAVEAAGTAPELTLSWEGLDRLPTAWRLSLRDLASGETADLRASAGYTFRVAPAAARGGGPAGWLASAQEATARGGAVVPRFELVVETGAGTAAEAPAGPREVELSAVRPNPTAGPATVRFGLPAAGPAAVAVYDLVGRRVATLAEGELAAGWHERRLDAARLSAGVYVVRMQAGRTVRMTRVTVLR